MPVRQLLQTGNPQCGGTTCDNGTSSMRVGVIVAVTLVALAIFMAVVQVWLKRLLRKQEELERQAQAKDHASAIAVVIVQPDNSISLAAKPAAPPEDGQGWAGKTPAGSLAKPDGCLDQLPASQ